MGNKRDFSAERQSLKDKLMAIILLETSKDYKEMDSDLVTECVDFLMELEGKEKLTKKEIEQRVNAIPFKGKVTAISSYTKKRLRAKRLAVIAAILAVIIALLGIIAVGSGDTISEFYRKLTYSVMQKLEDNPTTIDGITFNKSDKTTMYSSIEALIESEKIEILYPTWLPQDEKIIGVWYSDDYRAETYVFQCVNPINNISVELNKSLTETLKSNCTKTVIADYSVYCIETPQYAQASFAYKNNLYRITSDTEDNLFRIIENLKEIN